MPILPLTNEGDNMKIEITENNDYVIIKLDKQLLLEVKDMKPENEVIDLKQLIEGRESIIKRSLLQVFFDKDLLEDIRYSLAKLLVYYYLEGKRYDRQGKQS